MATELLLRCTDCAAHVETRRHILWDCLPIPSYGDLRQARLITVGLNPSDNLFYRRNTRQVRSRELRLPMATDSGVGRALVPESALLAARQVQRSYFQRTAPVHPWFAALRTLLTAAHPDWTYESGLIAHLDTAACATDQWSRLNQQVRDHLQTTCHPHFLETLETEAAPDAWLLLNGRGVERAFRNRLAPRRTGAIARVHWSRGTFGSRHYFAWNVALQRSAQAVQVALGEQLRAEYFESS